MTFYEAALRVLEAAGKPLHVLDITQQSVEKNLLSHIGKLPEQTMLSRLAAMARRPRDRRVMVTAKDTFGLVEWQLPEDAEALAVTGAPEPNPEEDLPPLRPDERHPIPQADIARSVGRHERKRRFEEHEGQKRRRFPPLAEVVFEMLSEAQSPLVAEQLLSSVLSKSLAQEDLTLPQLLSALLEDNQKRIDAGRRPQFSYGVEEASVALEPPDSSTPAAALQETLARVAGVPMEDGRPVFPSVKANVETSEEAEKRQTAALAVKDARRATLRILRRRLSELDSGAFEKAAIRMLYAQGFREIKVARRSKEGPLLTCRKREGSLEWRLAARLLKGRAGFDRKVIQDLRKELGHYAAHLGLVISTSDMRGDVRAEAMHGSPLVWVWAGEALAEKFVESRVGVQVETVELYDVDDAFFEQARKDAEASNARREERLRERSQREATEQPLEAASAGQEAEASGGAPEDGVETEGDEADNREGSSPVDRRRRRRRRRRRGPRPEGATPGSVDAGSDSIVVEVTPEKNEG